MTSKVKGIVVEIGGDTSGLQKALKTVNSAASSLSKELKGVNSLLKLDPKNTELLTQKQKLLADEIALVSTKLKELKSHEKEVAQSGIQLTEEQEKEYRALQREIVSTEQTLKNLKIEASKWTQASIELEKFGNKVIDIGNEIEGIGKKLGAVSAATGALITLGIAYNAEIEKSTKSMEAFLGNSEEAEKVVEDIKKQSQASPFDLTNLIKANQMLITADVNAEKSTQTISALADAIALTGGGNDELTRMASNLQQIQNAGKATSMDIRQFAYAGIDIYGILAETTGKTTEELKKMDISFEDLSNALIKASKEGGKYYKGQEKSANTLSGQVNTLKKDFKELLGEITESLLPVIKKVINRVSEIIKKFKSLDEGTKERIAKIGLVITALSPALIVVGKLISSLGTVITTLSKVTGAIPKLVMAISTINPVITLTVAAFAAAVAATGIYINQQINHIRELQQVTQKEAEKIKDNVSGVTETLKKQNDSWNELKSSLDEQYAANTSEIETLGALKNELSQIVDENGRVKDGYEKRANYILNQLSNAFGIEFELNDQVIEDYQEISREIDNLITKRKAEIALDVYKEEYAEALKKKKEAVGNLDEAYTKLNEALIDFNALSSSTNIDKKSIDEAKDSIQGLLDEISTSVETIGEYGYTIENYEGLLNATTTGTAEEVSEALEKMNISYKEAERNQGDSLQEQVVNQENYVKKLERLHEILKNSNKEMAASIVQEQIDAENEALAHLREALDETGQTIENDTTVVKAVQGQTNDVNAALTTGVNGREWGEDILDEMSSGLQSSSKISQLLNAATNVASKIKDILGFSIPKVGPLSNFDESMPDMIELMAKGLRSSYPKLEFETEKIAEKMKNILELRDIDITHKVIDTEPTVVSVNFYPQQMTEDELERAFNYVDKRFGNAY